jgi:PAS domain S-box-containing protein
MASILIIDDDRSVCDILFNIIHDMGHCVTCSHTLCGGLGEAVTGKYDLILLDVGLPDGNAQDAIARIQQVEPRPQIIIITSPGDGNGAELAIRNGVWDYIQQSASVHDMTLPIIRALQYREEGKAKCQGGAEPGLLELDGITSRTQAEKALRESAWFQQQLIDALPVPVFFKDPEGRYLGCNKAFESFLNRGKDEIIGKSVSEIAPGELAEIYLEKDLALLSNPGDQIYESSMRDADGLVRNVVFHKATFYKPDGSVGGLIGAVLDITEQKRAEEDLRASEERYRLIFDYAPLGIMHFDQTGTVRNLNDKFAEIIGASREKTLGFNMLEGVRDPAYLQAVKDAIEGGFGYYEGDYRSVLGGKTTPLSAIYKRISAEDGKFSGAVGIFEDITERRRAEKELRDSEQQLQSIIQGYPLPAFVIGKDHRVLYWNKALEEMSKIKANEVVGTDLHWRALYGKARPCMADLLLDEAPIEVISHWYNGIPSKSSLLEEAYEATAFFPRVGEEGKWLHCVAAAIRNSVGTLVGAIETVEDVTERKKAEEALISANRQLNDIIEFLPDATMVIDRDKKVIAWNRAIEEMTGVTKKEMIGKGDHAYTVPFYGDRRSHLLDLIDAPDEELESRYQHITKKGGTLSAETYVPCVYGGQGAYVFATCAPLFDAHGNRVGAIESIRDVTEPRQAQAALRQSEEKYRELVENANSIILRMDSVGKVTFFNEFAQGFFGYSEEEIVGKNVVGTIVPPVESTTGRDLRLMVEDIAVNPDRYASNINENMRRGGERVWIAWTNKPIRSENGRVTETLCVGNDITERKQAEEALKRANILLFTQNETSIDGIMAVDENDTIISSNQRFADMWGISREVVEAQVNALVLRSVSDKVIDPRAFLHRVDYLNAHRDETSLEEIALKDGRTFERYSAPMNGTDGRYYGRVSYFRDITERKLMEEAVAEAEAKYRGIFENALMGIFQSTPEGRLLSLNMAFARILGYDCPEEVLNSVSDISRQIYVNPDRRSELLRLIEENEMVQDFEVQFFKKDKSSAWITLNMRAVRDANGKIIHMDGIAEDITESKRLASQLNQAQKMEAIGTLAGGIAHDFNNMLMPIIGYCELSLNAVPQGSRLHHNIEQILLSGNRARDLVKQILTFSRKREQERRPVQVSLLVKETLKLLRSSLPSTIEIRKDIDAGAIDGTTMADPTQIHQVLMNLCTNAAHAMGNKGGVLSISLKGVDINSAAISGLPDLAPGSYLKLSVADTGHGMDEAVRQRIFDPYFTTKGPSKGTGLGLSLVYGIITSLSGGIAVFSVPGQGTTFDVYFPRTKTLQAPMVEALEPLPTGKGLILVVDDEQSIVDMLKQMLESLGYDVAARYSSSDALQAFGSRADSFDLVISDMTMPNMTGIVLAREILKIRPDTPIILCTGFSEGVDENRAKLLGIKEFLMKPVALRDLATTVKKILFQGKPIT